jgi:hypothetical protein
MAMLFGRHAIIVPVMAIAGSIGAKVAATRGVPEERVRALVAERTERSALGFIGELRVSVRRLNLALASLHWAFSPAAGDRPAVRARRFAARKAPRPA